MIPLRDSHPSSTTPIVNYSLIAINIFVFFIEISSSLGMDQFIYHWGLVPARYSNPNISQYFPAHMQLISFLSFMFLHGGWLHLIGNMWTLYIFGDNVEDQMGSFKYLAFYLLCGFISGFTHFMFNYHDNIPVVGASGAIAGVMGAYFVLFPGSKILTLIPIIIIPWFVELPAFIFLGFWFLMQVFNAAGSHGGGIAWWAHISGFIAGALLLRFFGKLPSMGFSQRVKHNFERKKTPEITTIKTLRIPDSLDCLGQLEISAFEAITGCIKKVNIPWGFYSRLYKVNIPPNIKEKQKIRLAGVGMQDDLGNKGDLYLEIKIRNTSFSNNV